MVTPKGYLRNYLVINGIRLMNLFDIGYGLYINQYGEIYTRKYIIGKTQKCTKWAFFYGSSVYTYDKHINYISIDSEYYVIRIDNDTHRADLYLVNDSTQTMEKIDSDRPIILVNNKPYKCYDKNTILLPNGNAHDISHGVLWRIGNRIYSSIGDNLSRKAIHNMRTGN